MVWMLETEAASLIHPKREGYVCYTHVHLKLVILFQAPLGWRERGVSGCQHNPGKLRASAGPSAAGCKGVLPSPALPSLDGAGSDP